MSIPLHSPIPTTRSTIKKVTSKRSQIVCQECFAFAIVHSKPSSSYLIRKWPLHKDLASTLLIIQMLARVHALRWKWAYCFQQKRSHTWTPKSWLLVLFRKYLQLCWRKNRDIFWRNRRSSLHDWRDVLSKEYFFPLLSMLLLPQCWIHHFWQS